MVNYYDMIFKRKSFHLFRGVGNEKITNEELKEIEKAYSGFASLYPQIKTAIRIVPASKVNFKRDAQYCVLIYSENKENYLMNAGYIGEQLDLWLVKHNIGSLWYGIGKPDEQTYDGMDFVIMFAIHKVSDDNKYRKNMFKAKRKPLSETWLGEVPDFANIARFAPSACNSQPWYIENKNGKLTVYRHKKSAKIGFLPEAAMVYFNRIDMGIYLCIFEICLYKNGVSFKRELFTDNENSAELIKVAEYSDIQVAE